MKSYKVKIFLDVSTFEEIVLFDDSYPNLNEIFKYNAEFVMDISDEDFEMEFLDCNSPVSGFMKAHDVTILPQSGILNRLGKDKLLLQEQCHAIVFLDVEEKQARSLGSDYGVLVLSKDNINDDVFNNVTLNRKVIKEEIMTADIFEEWSILLKAKAWLPYNSLIITDGYLFSKTQSLIENNVQGLLNALLPLNLKTEFHVLICTSHPSCSAEMCNSIIGRIKSNVTRLRDYEILLEFIFCSEPIHQRKIISNYNVLVADKGFILFSGHGGKTKVLDTNTIYSRSFFQNITNSVGDTECSMAMYDIGQICKIHSEIQNQYSSDLAHVDYTKRILGDCHRDKSLVNRLAKDYVAHYAFR